MKRLLLGIFLCFFLFSLVSAYSYKEVDSIDVKKAQVEILYDEPMVNGKYPANINLEWDINYKDSYITNKQEFYINALTDSWGKVSIQNNMNFEDNPNEYTFRWDEFCGSGNPCEDINKLILMVKTLEDYDGICSYLDLADSVGTETTNKCYGSKMADLTSGIVIPEPPEVEPPALQVLINQILEWIKSIFDKLKDLIVSQTIYGDQTVTPGSTHTYQIDISTDAPDTDYTDGHVETQWGAWAVVDEDGNALYEKDVREVNGRYQQDATFVVPQQTGNYILIALIYQIDQDYNYDTGQWEITKDEVVEKEAIDIKNELPIPTKPTFQISEVFNKIIDWIKNFFSNLFG